MTETLSRELRVLIASSVRVYQIIYKENRKYFKPRNIFEHHRGQTYFSEQNQQLLVQ